jgi:hypothetical protein
VGYRIVRVQKQLKACGQPAPVDDKFETWFGIRRMAGNE